MKENQNIKKPLKKDDIGSGKNRMLFLYNDNVNTFDYVITCLIEVCEHDIVQAEQCAFITHYKGKCDIKKGDYKSLKTLRESLIEKGLKATID
ncbi:MAG: ATP-dependent Clp protease adaptor ClpS [Bacteroidales bacterium]|nr:ATP-dependent Clp protease adaptor ClpS [Bacteroidales bacterium]